MAQGNLNSRVKHKHVDFDLQISFQPIKIIYQVVPINQLFKFLKVEEFTKQAIEKLESFKQSVSLADVLKMQKRNRLRIEIASPILVIPFKKNNDINSECWIFNMGNFELANYDQEFGPTNKALSLKTFKNYKVQISQIMMRYAPSYK